MPSRIVPSWQQEPRTPVDAVRFRIVSDTGISSEDWPARATATAVGYVDRVRDLATGRALSASRIAVFAVAMAFAAVTAVLLLLILVIRLLVWATDFIPGVETGETYVAYLIIGTIFVVAGVLTGRKAVS